MTFLLAFALAGAIAFGAILLFQSIRQNGRILLRLEAIEQQLAALGTPNPSADSRAVAQGLSPGTRAPAFQLPTLDGGVLDFPTGGSKKSVLIFFDPACGFCRKMAPQLAGFNEGGNPAVVIVASGDAEATRTLLAAHGVRLQAGLQPRRDISLKYQVTGTPMGYLIDEQGVVASELAVGASALLRLAGAPGDPPAVHQGNKPLSESRITRTGLPAGTRAPSFQLPRIDGGELSISEYRGQRVLLVFSDPHCGPCMNLAPQLEEYHRSQGDPRIVMVSRGDGSENRKKAAELNLTFPIVLQRQWEISREYGIFNTPVGFLIDEHGTIVHNVAVGADAILSVLNATTSLLNT